MARPRDQRIDHAVLDAVRELLAESGYRALTMEAVAARADTTKPAIRRRWPSLTHLAVDAITEVVGADPTPDTGCTHCDLIIGIESLRTTMTGPVLMATLPALISDLRDDARLRTVFFDRFFDPRRRSSARAIERGIARGDIRPDTNVDLLLDMMVSAVTFRMLYGHLPITPGHSEDVVDILMRGITTPEWAEHHPGPLTHHADA